MNAKEAAKCLAFTEQIGTSGSHWSVFSHEWGLQPGHHLGGPFDDKGKFSFSVFCVEGSPKLHILIFNVFLAATPYWIAIA